MSRQHDRLDFNLFFSSSNFMKQTFDDFTLDENVITSIKFYQKSFVSFEISQKIFKLFYRRDIAQIFEHLFQVCNLIHVVNETQKKIANTLNEIIEKYYDLRNQIYIIDE